MFLEYYVYGPYVDHPGEYDAGRKFSPAGDIPGGGSTKICNLFGMGEDESEVLSLQSGSGYVISTLGPRKDVLERKFAFGGSNLHYVSTTAEFFAYQEKEYVFSSSDLTFASERDTSN